MKTSTMRIRTLEDANAVYLCADHPTLHPCRVYHPLLWAFSVQVNVLEHSLGDSAASDFWVKILRRLKQHRFFLAAAPLPLNYDGPALTAFLQSAIQQCAAVYPDHSGILETIQRSAGMLARSDDNPILNVLEEIVHDPAHSAVLLKETRLSSYVEPIFRAHPALAPLEITTATELRGAQVFQHLCIIGPGSWFRDHEYVLTAPRARQLSLIRFSWLSDMWMREPAFAGTPPVEPVKGSPHLQIASEASFGKMAEGAMPGLTSHAQFDVLPTIDWQRISTRMNRRTADERDQEEVDSRLFALASDLGVMLETSEQSTALIIDLAEAVVGDSEHEGVVQRVRVNEITPDMFLLLRTSGGGDYVAHVADILLQAEAQPLRAHQQEWKTCLRQHVRAFGVQETVASLRRRGAVRAADYLVRNWMSSRNIRPLDERDFQAIMDLVGLREKENQYWQSARRIAAAHRAAGFQIRKLLLERVAREDLRPLLRAGWMEFELPEAAGGTLTAYRVEQIAPSIVTVPITRIGRPFRLEEM